MYVIVGDKNQVGINETLPTGCFDKPLENHIYDLDILDLKQSGHLIPVQTFFLLVILYQLTPHAA